MIDTRFLGACHSSSKHSHKLHFKKENKENNETQQN
jgi:hypothetical protein